MNTSELNTLKNIRSKINAMINSHQKNNPYELAESYIGTKEIKGDQHNNIIVKMHQRIASWIRDDETPWCSSFVNYIADETGHEGSGKLNARSFLKVGREVKLKDAVKGDVVILWRGSKNSWKGHVGFYDRTESGHIYILGGNQGDEVNISKYPKHRLLSIRRLNKKTT